MALEIFKLVGSIFVDNEAANNSIQKTDEKAQGVGQTLLKGIGTAVKWGAGLATAAAAGATALYGVATSAAGAMDEIDKGSAKIGISKQAYQEWDYVLGQNGMSIDKLETGMKTLVTQMDSASSGTASACENFDKLGISIYDSNGKLKDQETMLNETMMALANMENGTEKARLATELFGKAGVEMMPMLNGGAEGIAALTDRAHELGLIMSDEAVTAGVVLGDTIDDVKQSFGAIVNTIGVMVMPVIQSLLDWVLSNMPVIQNVVGTVFGVIETVVTTVMSVVQALFGNLTQSIGENADSMKNIFQSLWDVCLTLWESNGKPVWDAIGFIVTEVAGLFAQHMPEIMAFFQRATEGMQDTWNNHLKPIFDAIADVLQNYLMPAFEFVFKTIIEPLIINVFRVIADLWNNTLKPVFDGICDFLLGVFTNDWQSALQGILNIVIGIFNGIRTAIEAPMDLVKDIVESAIDFIRDKFNFEWSLPELKLPHFNISGEFSLNPLSVPSFGIDWYAEGGIMKDPTAFGFNPFTGNLMVGGEAGAEAIAPIDTLQAYVAEAVAAQNGPMIAVLNRILDAILRMDENMGDNLRNALEGLGIVLNDREFARLVRAVRGC